MQDQLKQELYDVISGKSQVRFGTTIQSVASYLSKGSQPSSKIENSKQFKEQEAKRLEIFVSENNLWISDIDFTQYVSEGAEQRVYLKNSDHVLKLNDGIYYSSWRDYFYNLLIHNYFFEDTAYELLGFTKENEILYAVVQQSYVTITSNTDLNQLKEFLTSNGFQNTRNNDYFNQNLGIILEDLHDENVLTRNNVLYFIDTVFYLTEEFWSKK
jgi:hypothetical protein